MGVPKLSPSHEDFKLRFRELDDSVLISIEQWASLTGQTRSSIYSARARGMLPTPVINQNRLIRWTAGQYRAWAHGLADATHAPRGGRPRLPVSQAREIAQKPVGATIDSGAGGRA